MVRQRLTSLSDYRYLVSRCRTMTTQCSPVTYGSWAYGCTGGEDGQHLFRCGNSKLPNLEQARRESALTTLNRSLTPFTYLSTPRKSLYRYIHERQKYL
jgi:hypothetical protein